MRHAAFLLPLLFLYPTIANADELPDAGDNPYASPPEGEGAAATADEPEAAPTEAAEAEDAAPRSRRENRVKDHAIGLGYYYTHMQWNDFESGSTPQVDYHAMAVRYAYYIGQAQRFGFIINAAATVPLRADQSGVKTDPSLNGTYHLFDDYDRRVGFDIGLMAGTHRMLTDDLACIAGVGMHVGILKLNDQGLAIHEYIAIGAASVFSLRYRLGELWTVGADVNASLDFRDSVHHQSPLDYALNMGLTAMVGLHF